MWHRQYSPLFEREHLEELNAANNKLLLAKTRRDKNQIREAELALKKLERKRWY